MVISVPLLEVPEWAFMTPYNVCIKLIPKQNKKRWSGRRKVCYFSTAWDNERLDSCLLNFHYQAMFDRWFFPTYEMLSKNKENTCFSNSENDFGWQTPSNCLTQSYVSCGTIVGGKKSMEIIEIFWGRVSSQLARRQMMFLYHPLLSSTDQ